MPSRPLPRIMAILRTRLAGAVLMPSLLAGAYARSRGAFAPAAFLVLLLGLLAAEFTALFVSDLVDAGKIPGVRIAAGPPLPGSPMWPRLLRSPAGTIAALAALAGCGSAALVVFLVRVGPGILVPFAGAAGCAILYTVQPFPGSYLATAAVPSLITGGTMYALTGKWDAPSLYAGIPVCLVSVGVILTYRSAYRGGTRREGGKVAVVLCYAGSLASVAVLAAIGVFRWTSLPVILPGAALAGLAWKLFERNSSDPVPATAAGVILHASVSLLLAILLLV